VSCMSAPLAAGDTGHQRDGALWILLLQSEVRPWPPTRIVASAALHGSDASEAELGSPGSA